MSARRRGLTAFLLAGAACARQPESRDGEAGAQASAGDTGAPALPADTLGGSSAATTSGGADAPGAADSARPPATRPPAERTTPGAQRDASAATLRGTVRVVGSSPLTRVSLRPADGSAAVVLSGDTAALRRAAALEVEVRGRPGADGREFAVERFTVLAANGEPALDGIVRRDGEALALETAGGRVRLGNPPAELRDQVGARVWVGGDPATGPNPYGVLVPAP